MSSEHGGMSEAAETTDSASATVTKTLPDVKPAPFPGMLGVGTPVRQKVSLPVWHIKGYHLSDDKTAFQYLAAYTDEAGQEHEHYFTHAQIEEVR